MTWRPLCRVTVTALWVRHHRKEGQAAVELRGGSSAGKRSCFLRVGEGQWGGEWWSDPGNRSKVEPMGVAFCYWDRQCKWEQNQGGLWSLWLGWLGKMKLPFPEWRRQKSRGLAGSWNWELCLKHLQLEIVFRHPSRDVKLAFVYFHLEFNWEIQARHKNFVMKMVTKGQEFR